MKKFLFALLIFIITPMLYSTGVLASKDNMRGIWVSSVYNLDFPSSATTDSTRLKSEIDAVVENSLDMGFNTVFLQVRPGCDALYPSSLYPWSRFLTGKNGIAPSGGFDPLEYWVSACHSKGIELHAWINPYRVTTGGKSEYDSFLASHPAKLHPDWVVKYSDGNYYLDPAIPEVRQFVIDGAKEILDNYDVDGIHIDDYFYPGTDFNDSVSYSIYGGGFSSKADWRRNNVDLLVKGLYDLCHSYSSVFGVSPGGIWDNKSANSYGSNTNGRSTYSTMYADSRGWVLNGYVDYIAPQIYWENGHALADYSTLVKWWSDVCKDTSVKLYIGLADYKSADAASSSPWYGGEEIRKQMEYNTLNSVVDGEIHFRYKIINNNLSIRNVVKTYYANTDTPPVTEPENTVIPDPVIPEEPIIVPPSNVEPDRELPPLYDEYDAPINDGVKVMLNGEYINTDTPAIIVNDRTLVPMRALFEALGADVKWDNTSSTAIAVRNGETLKVQIGAKYLTKDGRRYELDSPAIIVNSRTLVPVRAISEAFGFEVKWNNNTRTVIINE